MATHYLLRKEVRDIALPEIEAMSEDDVRAMFARIRWGEDNQQICPECGTIAKHYWKRTRKQWQCRELGCGRTFSVLAGTKFEDSKLPLRRLLQIVFTYVANAKGISAVQLSRQFGVTHKTAYVLMQKLREALMVTWDYSPLANKVHVDGAHVGGRIRKERDKKSKSAGQHRDRIARTANPYHPNRRIAIVATEVIDGKGSIRVIPAIIPAETGEHVVPFVESAVTPGTRVHTDESNAYAELRRRYDHHSVNHTREFQSQFGIDNNQAESFFTRVRRFYVGTVHRLTPKYLADYVTEMAFREQYRRQSNNTQLEVVLKAVLTSGTSVFWRRYYQGHHRKEEILAMDVQEAVAAARMAAIELMAKQQAEALLGKVKKAGDQESAAAVPGEEVEKSGRSKRRRKPDQDESRGPRPFDPFASLDRPRRKRKGGRSGSEE